MSSTTKSSAVCAPRWAAPERAAHSQMTDSDFARIAHDCKVAAAAGQDELARELQKQLGA